MRRGFQLERGLTLVEWMLAVSIVAAGSLLLLVFLRQEMDFMETTTVLSDVRARSQLVLERVVRDLRHGTRQAVGSPPNLAIPPPPNNTSLTLYMPTDLNNDGRIVDAAGDIEWDTANPVSYQYDPGAQQLQRVVGGTTRVVAHHVTAVTFQDQTMDASLKADEVRVQLTIQEITPHQRVMINTAVGLIQLRN